MLILSPAGIPGKNYVIVCVCVEIWDIDPYMMASAHCYDNIIRYIYSTNLLRA